MFFFICFFRLCLVNTTAEDASTSGPSDLLSKNVSSDVFGEKKIDFDNFTDFIESERDLKPSEVIEGNSNEGESVKGHGLPVGLVSEVVSQNSGVFNE